MKYTKESHKILLKAEESLREVLHRALKEQCYGDVAKIASFAEGVAALLRSQNATCSQPSRHSSRERGVVAKRVDVHRSGARRSQKQVEKYPRFERDGDKLLKIGWSKNNEETYEHRAPKEAIWRFREHLAESVVADKIFTMEDLLPVPNNNGGEVPSYQAYLALAWLRDRGVVRKKGRDGYVYSERAINEESVEELWAALSSRD